MANRYAMRQELIKHSRFLSLVLRHRPSVVGVELNEAGWVDVNTLLKAIHRLRPKFTQEMLIEIVETNDKKRFAFSVDKKMIRASQGHSISVDLGLPHETPPNFLYHGTAEQNLPSIKGRGLVCGKRNHVHLSSDEATAQKVGSRHGRPIVLEIDAGHMNQSGHIFYLSANGVWLTLHVPIQFISFPN